MKTMRHTRLFTLAALLSFTAICTQLACQQSTVSPPPDADSSADDAPEPPTIAIADTADEEISAGSTDKPDAEANQSSEMVTGDWAQWGGTSYRNNAPNAKNIPINWNIGSFDRKTRQWIKDEAVNIKWVARLGSQTYGNAVVADGRIYVGTNNGAGYIERYPANRDLGCLICFDEQTGKFLWQHSSEKLSTGRVHDWPLQGICCAPLVEGKRLWFVTSRGEVRCLDTEGFYDDENDGPYQDEEFTEKQEADVIWSFNMMAERGVSQHNMCSCSVTALGDILFVCTSNGVSVDHLSLPSPDAPSFMAMDKNTGEVLWTDKSPGRNILHGQWSSPAVGVMDGVPQVIFAGGDGWIYSFRADRGKEGDPELLWKFDGNPKETRWTMDTRCTRNNVIATPVIHDGLVYVAMGQDPEHGDGPGHLWCIDPTKRGDVSPELAVLKSDPTKSIPHKRLQAVEQDKGEIAVANPNSAVVWHYDKFDQDGDGDIGFEEEMHRSCGTVAIKNNLLFIADFSGLFHCLDAKTGKVFWTHDMLSGAWASPLIVEDHVYIGDEDGDVSIFNLSSDPKIAMKEIDGELHPINATADDGLVEVTYMGNSVYSTPIVANGVLYISNKSHLFAIEAPQE